MMDQNAIFIATRHSCLWCTALNRGASKRRHPLTFCASEADTIQMLPDYIKTAWTLQRGHAGHLCDEKLVDFVRASATRSTWARIASVLNELRATKKARLILKYKALCATLGLRASSCDEVLRENGMVDSKWIANIYEADSAARSFDVTSELLAEEAGDIIAVDWTRDAGTRCQGKWMFNVTDENGKVLTSVVTATAAPAEVEPAMRDLHLRGAKPKVMYVDCECCGAWQAIVDKLWPDAYIVLDSFHAIRRLTQTTASTKHPWHADFCKAVSQAVFADDARLSRRFREALKRSRLSKTRSARLKAECVTRRIKDKSDIETSIEDVMASFANRVHATFGSLLTPKTLSAWSSLKSHIRNGCLNDPTGVDLYSAQAEAITIGGEYFDKFKSKRGASALEGFHGIQKGWLGQQMHSRRRGLALVADGSVRHNRKRRNCIASKLQQTPLVYAPSLLTKIDRHHRSSIDKGLRRLPSNPAAQTQSPVRDLDGGTSYYLRSLLQANTPEHLTLEASPDRSKEERVSPNMRHEQAIDVTAELATAGSANDLHTAPSNEEHALQTQAAMCSRQVEAWADKSPQQYNKEEEALSEAPPISTTSRRSHCRSCGKTGMQCRLHKRIQWCASADPPFDEWITNTFPAKKAVAMERTQQKAAARGKPKGRPRKHKAL